MSTITFDENKYKIKSRTIFGQAEVPGMTKFLLRKGIVKNEKQATFIMFMVTIILIVSSVFLIYSNFFNEPEPALLTPEDELLLQQNLN